MNYQQTLEFLYNQLPMYQRTGQAAYKADLNNTLELDRHLGHPHRCFKSIHVAGTNGKGSVSHMLASVLQSAGYKTGLYTSPHLVDFRERIRVDGEMVPEDFVVSFIDRHKALIETVAPSFFEMTVAMAFDYFARKKVDVAVVEVGLGGRLDSTNIITPVLSIITNIGFDHTALLGNTIEKIAGEKAGIIKPCIPVVIGRLQPDVQPVFEEVAARMGAPLTVATGLFEVVKVKSGDDGQDIRVCAKNGHEELLYRLPLRGNYQQENLVTVLAAVEMLRHAGYRLHNDVVARGLQKVVTQTGLAGRWQIIGNNPLVICDAAHNQDGLSRVVNQLSGSGALCLRMVIGVVSDKDIDALLAVLPREAFYYFTQAAIPRALSCKELQRRAQVFGLRGNAFPQVREALAAARDDAQPGDIIFVGGSTFTVAEVLEK